MSSLGSLLGGGKAESNDSLKYHAPREPKKGGSKSKTPQKIPAASVQEQQSEQNTSTEQLQAVSQKATSQVLASAAVRLFQLNPQTNAYDAVNDGNPLGCVIVGMNLNYQLLIYNGQKVPQATAAISGNFQYNLRNLYVSFGDSNGNSFSALFDSKDTLNTFLRSLMAVVCHVRCHSADAPQAIVKGHLPPLQVETDASPTVLTSGVSAGCRFKAWEVAENDFDNPTIAFSGSPFLESSEITKIKVGGGEDPIGGMGEALVGLSKNDKVIIGVPTGLAYTNCSGDMSLRQRPGSWVMIEVEIVKVKSDKKDKKKEIEKAKEKAKEKESSVPQSPVQNPPEDDSSAGSRTRSGSVSERMAKLAQQSGGSQVAMLSVSSTREQDFEKQQREQQAEFDRKLEMQRREQEHALEKQRLEHEKQQLEMERQKQQQQIALVEGQEARSYYVPTDSASSYVRQQQAAERTPAREDFAQHFTSLQQTIMSLQTSVMGIHSKLDGLSSREPSTSSSDSQVASVLQQMQAMQQQQMAAMYGGSSMFMGGMTGHGPQGMTGGYPYHQGGPHASQGSGAAPRGSELVRGVQALVEEVQRNEQMLQRGGDKYSSIDDDKTKRLEEKIETLLAKNEKLMSEKSELWEKNASISESSAESSSKISRLQREIDSLRREKEEDSDEMERQKRSFSKRIASLNEEIEALTAEASRGRGAEGSAADKDKIAQLERSLEAEKSEKSKIKTELSELEGVMASSNAEWQRHVDHLKKEMEDSISSAREASQSSLFEQEKLWSSERLKLQDEIAEKEKIIAGMGQQGDSSSEVTALTEEVAALKEQVQQAETTNAELNRLLVEAQEEKKALASKSSELEGLLKEAMESSGRMDDGAKQELVTEFVQDLFGRLHFAFVPPSDSSVDLDDPMLSPNAVMKKCKKVLKQGATEFSSAAEANERSTFVKLSS